MARTKGSLNANNPKNFLPTLSNLTENYNVAQSYYAPIFRKMKILDAVDNARLWQAINAKFPKYQILPDTNWVSYIKSNLVASIYTVAKSAQILPTSEEDRDLVENLNVALDYIWDTCEIGFYQMQAGSAAALFNVGITQVGWDADAEIGKVGSDFYYKGNVYLKNIHPIKFMRDPFAESLNTASYCMTWEDYHKSVILADPKYKEKFQAYLDAHEAGVALADPIKLINNRPDSGSATDYYKVFTHFVRYQDAEGKSKIAEIHTVNNEAIIYQNDEIKPNCFPFVELFCNLPEGDITGTSEPAKILSNNIAYNILNSMLLTAEYKNQRPPKFISSASGLNLRTFTQYGSDADHTFIVNGDASRAVHYHQFPIPSPTAQNMQNALLRDTQTTSGIDGRYTGRDTGSVLTTGGVEDMLTRVTLIDAPKIANYERYTKQLTKLILANFIEFSMERTYIKKDPMTGEIKPFVVDYKDLSNEAFYHYAINISSELPKNKQRVASMANMLMEKQMQYGTGNDAPELITPEEWLEMQDLPNKEYMLKRMNIQRLSDITARVATTLLDFSSFVKNGMAPDDAIAAIARNQMAEQSGNPAPIEVPPMEPAESMDPAYDQALLDSIMLQQSQSQQPQIDPTMLDPTMVNSTMADQAIVEQPVVDDTLLF